MDPRAVLALCQQHAEAEAHLDIDGVLATLVPEPCYEFFPLARSVTGWANIERFYRHQYPRFVPQVVGYQLLGEWTNEQAALQEYVIDVHTDDRTASYRVLSMMSVDEGLPFAHRGTALLRRGVRPGPARSALRLVGAGHRPVSTARPAQSATCAGTHSAQVATVRPIHGEPPIPRRRTDPGGVVPDYYWW
jgi:hypothetical protein